MHPDAHAYIHRAEQAARARAHERSADHPAPARTTLSQLRRNLNRRRHASVRPRPARPSLALRR